MTHLKSATNEKKKEFDESLRVTASFVNQDIYLVWKSWNHAISIKDKRWCLQWIQYGAE